MNHFRENLPQCIQHGLVSVFMLREVCLLPEVDSLFPTMYNGIIVRHFASLRGQPAMLPGFMFTLPIPSAVPWACFAGLANSTNEGFICVSAPADSETLTSTFQYFFFFPRHMTLFQETYSDTLYPCGWLFQVTYLRFITSVLWIWAQTWAVCWEGDWGCDWEMLCDYDWDLSLWLLAMGPLFKANV